jgi:two-component system, sensor histidine kinase ChiS
LVAEDNADLREFTMETLSSEFCVVGVENGNQAWAELSERRFDVVVSDQMMPELDGLGLITKMKAHPGVQSTPVILVTARGGIGNLTIGLDAGADDYLSKPFAPEELLARVRAAERMHRLQAQLRDQAHAAGAASVTRGILHNVGNALNSVSVSAELIVARASGPVQVLEKLAQIWAERCTSLQATARFFTEDERGLRFGEVLARVANQMKQEHLSVTEEAQAIVERIHHTSAIIRSQLSPDAHRIHEPTDLLVLVRQAVRVSESVSGADKPTLALELGELPLVHADPHALLEVFVNLLNNARQAVRHLPGRIHIKAWRDRGEAIVQVEDNGSGIANDDLPKLFHQGFTTKPEGHGLGLHMSWITVQGLGGTINVDSRGPGLGSTFTVRLPTSAEQAAAAQ